jgi:uncharacterized Zn finger protein (UPF0148 family)
VLGVYKIKKENCHFCGHRWVRCSDESPIICPNCKAKFYSQEQLEKMRKEKKAKRKKDA